MFDFGESDVRKFYRYLGHSSGEWTELRAIAWPPSGSAMQAFVDNEEDFVAFCKKWNGLRNVYVGVNPRKKKGGGAEDVARIVVIPFDVDSPHPKDEPATDGELEEARKKAVELVSWICKKGFKPPMISMSGNGHHVLQKVNIKIEDLEAIRAKLEAYFHEAPTKGLDSIFDPPRILKVPGTMSVKGKKSEDRPYRLSYIVTEGSSEPDSLLAEHIEKLESYVEETPEKMEPEKEETATQKKIGRLRPCFRKFVKEGGRLSDVRGEDHLLRLALVQEAHSKGFSKVEIISLFKNALDFKEDLTTKQVDDELGTIIKKGPQPWRCVKIFKHHGCSLGEKCRNYKKNVEKHLTGEVPNEEEKKTPEQFFEINEDGSLGAFIPKLLGDEILKEYKFAATSEKSKIWTYKPDKGIWKSDGAELIHEEATKRLEHKFKNIYVSETVAYIRYTNYINQNVFGGSLYKIVVMNGVLDLNTCELTPFDPDLYEINHISVTYDPDAKCPKITRFLYEVLPPKNFDTIIEVVGYCLLKSYPIARIIIFVGEGANGKSQLIVIINKFLGRENTSKLTLQQIAENTFAPAQLFGKLANLAADIPATPIKYTGIIKTLTGGGDELTAHHKYFAMFDFMNFAKLIFSVNEVPPTTDTTPAWLRRPVLIEFPNTFPAGDSGTILDIGDKISTDEELSGLLNLAVAGLQRLLRQGKFTGEESFAKRAEQYIKESNPAQYFIIQFVEEDPNTLSYIEKPILYKNYVTLCHALKRRPLISNKFSMEIPLYLPYIDDGEIDKTIGETKKGKPQTRKTRVWYGIRIKTEELAQRIAELKIINIDTMIAIPLTSQKNKIHKVEGEEGEKGEGEREREGKDRIDKNAESMPPTVESLVVSVVAEGEDPNKEEKPELPPPNLQEKLDKLRTIIQRIETEERGAAMKEIREATNKAGLLWNPNHVKELVDALERDCVIYQPSPGFWRVSFKDPSSEDDEDNFLEEDDEEDEQ
jgi:putative DNA primase/helicase